MTRMIERWFPCQEVSENSEGGWGSGNTEANLFTWFAKRPMSQAKAAVLSCLLPWPEKAGEQRRLQELVRQAFAGRDAAHDDLVAELKRLYPKGASILDPFSGRAMIPLEAARLGVKAWGIDYSPVATIAGTSPTTPCATGARSPISRSPDTATFHTGGSLTAGPGC